MVFLLLGRLALRGQRSGPFQESESGGAEDISGRPKTSATGGSGVEENSGETVLCEVDCSRAGQASRFESKQDGLHATALW